MVLREMNKEIENSISKEKEKSEELFVSNNSLFFFTICRIISSKTSNNGEWHYSSLMQKQIKKIYGNPKAYKTHKPVRLMGYRE